MPENLNNAENNPGSVAANDDVTDSDIKMSGLDHSFKLGFDGKRATKNLTGLGNYSRWLIEQLVTHYPEHKYLVYTPKVKQAPRIKKFLSLDGIKLKLPVNANFLWRSIGILKDLTHDKVALYHGLSHEVPFTIQYAKIRSVVTIHDLIFLRYPQHYKFTDRLIYKFKSRYACRNADKVIAISEKTKADIVEFYGIPADKIEVIYQSCDDSFKQLLPDDAKQKVKTKYNLPDKYLLYVGTIESRKNLVALIAALKDIDESYHLVVIGRKTGYYAKVDAALKQHGLTQRVNIFQDMDFADLPAIYQNASVFVLPSYYEGFGIPVIEALYSGVPVVAATGSCLEEAGGPDSLYVAPNDISGIAAAVNKVLSDQALRLKMIENGLNYVQKFNNKALTDQLMNCYLALLKK